MAAPLVTLTTDFGTQDGYVAAMKGAMLRRVPELRLVDVTHDISPGDIEAAAFVLLQATPHFPEGSVHLAVVDPGVGGPRRAIAAGIGPDRFVAPDNGVLGHVLARSPAGLVHAIEHPDFAPGDASAVFHGRDIFGPVAAFLAAGGALDALGPRLEVADLVRPPVAIEYAVEAGSPDAVRRGVVIHVDRFGNLIANLLVTAGERGEVQIAGRRLPLARTYTDVAPGELVALRGSSGLLEVAVNGGSAARLTGVRKGDVIKFRVL